MLNFMRNKLVNVVREDADIFLVHGVLDDDIYGLELDLRLRISDLKILSVGGKFNRWTTSECPKAVPVLQRALGRSINEEEFSAWARKVIGRGGCRHYAVLLIECCHSAREAALMLDREGGGGRKGGEFHERPRRDDESRVSFQGVSRGSGASRPDGEGVFSKMTRTMTSGGSVIDLHVHTAPASACSSAPVDAIIKEAKGIGLDGICLTDHNHLWTPDSVDALRQKHGFLILRGNEITTDQGDVLVFGLNRPVHGIIKLQELREEVKEAGGFIIAAHPFRGFLAFELGRLGLTPEKAMQRPLFQWVDGVEVLNGKVTAKENSFASTVARGLGLPVTGGSDAHEVSDVGLYATRFSRPIQSEEELVRALREGGCSPVAFRAEMARRGS